MTLAKLKNLTIATIMSAALALPLSFGAALHNANAQTLQCGNRDVMVNTLDKRFKENRFAMGLSSSVSLLELFVSKNGTWTILTTRANGTTCIVAAGKSWVSMPVKLAGDGVSFQRH